MCSEPCHLGGVGRVGTVMFHGFPPFPPADSSPGHFLLCSPFVYHFSPLWFLEMPFHASPAAQVAVCTGRCVLYKLLGAVSVSSVGAGRTLVGTCQ